jgi:NADPH2 dehydrogenase
MMTEHYAQRASVPGTLLITEAVFISPSSRGRDLNAPGVFTPEQIAAWADVARAVHERGCFVFMQLWHVGRAAKPDVLRKQGLEMVSSSAVPIGCGYATPRELSEAEIWECIADFAQAARNAVVEAGFDGVEIHGANGYLVDQFTQDTCNRRVDGWGGSVEKRSRFAMEVVRKVCEAVGGGRVGLRLAPFTDFQGMGMGTERAEEQFRDLIGRVKGKEMAYLHLVEPRISGNTDRECEQEQSLDFALKAWDDAGPVIVAGGYDAESANKRVAELGNVAVAFGRQFTSNPDLPRRLLESLPLTPYDRPSFYIPESPDGYITWQEHISSGKTLAPEHPQTVTAA